MVFINSECLRSASACRKSAFSYACRSCDSERVWAQIEASDGGLFRSDDAGETWSRINEDRTLRQRAWYYTRVYAGPTNVDEVYVLNVRFWRSGDGGKSFESISTPHGDHHDLWIAPDDPKRMAIADDGGVQISVNRGERGVFTRESTVFGFIKRRYAV